MVTKGDVARRLASAAKTIRWVVHRLEPLPLVVDKRDESNGFARGLARGRHQAARTRTHTHTRERKRLMAVVLLRHLGAL